MKQNNYWIIVFLNMKKIFSVYSEYFEQKRNLFSFIITIILLALILYLLPRFLQFVEQRPGFSFEDPFLKLFEPIDLTYITFFIIYASLIAAILFLIKNPAAFHTALAAYSVMVVIRMLMMYSLPLEPPVSTIALKDPFVEFFGGGITLRKDLFFSGHTSTLFILFLTAVNKKLKFTLLLLTVLVAACVVIQHVHYTIDVIAAPFFAYCAYKIALKIKNFNY